MLRFLLKCNIKKSFSVLEIQQKSNYHLQQWRYTIDIWRDLLINYKKQLVSVN